MCGVWGISNYIKYDLEERFDFQMDGIIPKEWQHSVFRPHSIVPTVSRNSPNKLVMRHWSLIPPWIKDIKDLKYPTFNARAETVTEKPTYKNAWKKGQRCIFIATEFWEYKKHFDGKKKLKSEPFKFTLVGEPFAMAGIYQEWNDIQTVTMITCEPNHDMKDIHDRMPVILAQEDEDKWLSKDTTPEEAEKLLVPYPDGEFTIEQVSPFEKKDD